MKNPFSPPCRALFIRSNAIEWCRRPYWVNCVLTILLDVHYIEYSIYCGFINTVGLYIRQSYFHPFQRFFIHIDEFYPFFIHYSSNLPILNNVEKIVWPTVYVVLGVLENGGRNNL
jgi:hypothetical protein